MIRKAFQTLVSTFLFVGVLLAQDHPVVTNARFETRPYAGNLKGAIDSEAPTWFGYGFTSVSKEDRSCCWNQGNICACNLEGGRAAVSVQGAPDNGPVKLEGNTVEAVLFRVEHHAVERVNIYSINCPLDAGGLPFVWLDRVPVNESLTFLSSLVTAGGTDKVVDGSVLAIAQHDDGRADQILERFSAAPNSDRVRDKAIFWLGAGRHATGVPILKNILAHDPSEHIRDKALFALYVSNQPEGTDALLSAAKNDVSPHIRGQAIFWLAQRAGDRASSAILNAIQNDPDTHVKEQAVFALSQLPRDEGVPKLIEVARNQRNPEVQKKAFFWLGQSHDPRALAFIEQVLTR
jgi:HEAT repeats